MQGVWEAQSLSMIHRRHSVMAMTPAHQALKGHSCSRLCKKCVPRVTGKDEIRKMTGTKDTIKPLREKNNHLHLRRKENTSEVTSRKTILGLVWFYVSVTFAAPVSICHTTKAQRTNC